MAKAFAIIVLFGLTRTCAAQSVADSTADSQASSSAGEIFWLPLPVEEIETPDELDDGRAGELGFYASATARDGRAQVRRVEVARAGGSLDAGVSILGGSERAEAWTVALQSPRSRLEVSAGRITAGAAGMAFAETVGLARRASRIPMARADALAFSASTGVSSPAIVGIAITRPPRSARLGGWIAAGRRTIDGAQIAAAGAAAGAPWGAWSVAAGTLDGRKAAGASLVAHWAQATTGAEASVGPHGPVALVSVESGGGGVRVRGRWRYRREDARPVAAELTAETGSRHARCRMRAIQGPSGTTGSVGRIEVEGALAAGAAGPTTLRLGRSRTDGFSAAGGATLRRERYAVLETTVARSGGRRLSMLATRRERELESGIRTGTSLGATLDMVWRRRGALQLVVEATRVDADGGSAWGNGFFAGGATSLESRSRPGVSVSARGTVRVGRWNAGGLLQGREEASGRRATAATVWIQRALPAPAR
jgi:hypothetical protein